MDDEAKRRAMILGTRLRDYRKSAGLTVNGLARYSGVSAAYISRLERGQVPRPSAPTLQKLADKLNVNLPQLMGTERADEVTNARIGRILREAQDLNLPDDVQEAVENALLAILAPYRAKFTAETQRELDRLRRVAEDEDDRRASR